MESQNNSGRLETILQDTHEPQQIEGLEYQTHIDVYQPGTHVMYNSFDSTPKSPFLGGIGSQGSGYVGGSQGNIRKDLGYGLQERFDFSGHDDSEPHVNYDLLGADGKFSSEALGYAHSINLFDEEGNFKFNKDDTNNSNK